MLERYSTAVESKNLSFSDHQIKDADWIAAAGLIKDPLASHIARWLAGDHKQVFHIIGAIKNRYKKQFTLTEETGDQIQDALEWWKNPACKQCKGRKYVEIPETGRLSDTPCPCCNASGMQDHPHNGRAYAETLKIMDSAAAVAAQIKAKVA